MLREVGHGGCNLVRTPHEAQERVVADEAIGELLACQLDLRHLGGFSWSESLKLGHLDLAEHKY